MRCSSGLEECSTISGVPWIRTGSRWTSSYRSARDGAAAKCFFRRLLKDLPYKPKRLITDGLRSYGVARRALLPDVKHRTNRYLNNQAQDFLSAHAIIYGHFRPRRHRLSASGYRSIRARAFRVWPQEVFIQLVG